MEEILDFSNQELKVDLSQILHYGAIVKITPTNEESNSNLMFCDGFILTNIILQNFSSNQEDTCGALFRVVPSFLSEVQNHLINEMSEVRNMKCIEFFCIISLKL